MNDLNRRLSRDSEKLGLIAFTICVIIAIGFILYMFFSKDNSIEETRLEQFSGIVLDKYRIRFEHDSPVIKIKPQNKEDTVIYLNLFNANIFASIQIGDSISTRSGDSKVLISRKDTNFSVEKMDHPAP